MLYHNFRPVSIVSNWLHECNIPHSLEISKNELSVVRASSQVAPLKVRFVEDLDAPVTTPTHIALPTQQVTHRSLAVRLSAVKQVIRAAGYKIPKIAVRGSEEEPTRLNAADDLEAVILRYAEFRRAPNSVASLLPKYQTVIDMACRVAWARYHRIWGLAGLDEADLKSCAQVWAIGWLAEYSAVPLDTGRI